jgi:hypothetical protein
VVQVHSFRVFCTTSLPQALFQNYFVLLHVDLLYPTVRIHVVNTILYTLSPSCELNVRAESVAMVAAIHIILPGQCKFPVTDFVHFGYNK